MANVYLEYFYLFMIYVGWWLVPLVILFVYKKILSKYPIDVVIYEKRGENLVKTNDVAGRFDSPIAHYKLKMSKDSIEIPQYDWVLQCMHKPTNLFEKVVNLLAGKIGSITLFKYSSKQYKPIRAKVNGQSKLVLREIKDKHGNSIYIHRYELINPKQSLSKIDFEVIDWDDINHFTQELRAINDRYSPIKSFLEKYAPFIAVMMVVMALIFGGYYYAEIIKDAGAKASGLIGQAQANENQNINKDNNVPVIGDILPGQ